MVDRAPRRFFYTRGGNGSGVKESTQAGFYVFFGPGTRAGVKNLLKTGLGSGATFHFRQ